jgi:hypothetical protein
MDVRRLAAIDMWGTRGTLRRRRIILVEFVIGFLLALAVGAVIVAAAHTPIGYVIGGYVLGAGLNYAPLAWFAIGLYRPGALDAELAGVDKAAELRRYAALQFWIFVPLALVVFAASRRR